jgi:hypothetical protein
VTDGDLITASGTAPVEFARAIMGQQDAADFFELAAVG